MTSTLLKAFTTIYRLLPFCTTKAALSFGSVGCAICAAPALLLALSSCSSIDEAHRLIPIETTVPVDTTTVDPNADLDSLYNLPVAVVPRRVLIEDYTGQHCPNCPTFTSAIHDLQDIYANLLVPVAIHSDYMGIMEPEGLGNALGNYYFDRLDFSPRVKPAVQVSRFYNTVITTIPEINLYVEGALSMDTPLDIRMKAVQRDDDATKADIDVKVLYCAADANAVEGKLQVWVTEDSIKTNQDYLNGIHYTDYVHNHVLRAAVNGQLGEPVSVSAGSNQQEFHYTLTLSDAWKPARLAIVAFVYNDDEVVQVTKQSLRLATTANANH